MPVRCAIGAQQRVEDINRKSVTWSCSSPKGIGRSQKLKLPRGADIIGVSKSLEASGSEIEKRVRALGRKFHPYTCDFSKRASVQAFLQKVTSDFPVIDILVNNAGTILRKPAAELPYENWD
jgi:2-deoxy-D-gluconate 3-dehydrogenase